MSFTRILWVACLVGVVLSQTSVSQRPILWLSIPDDGLYMSTQTASGFFPFPDKVVNKSHVTRPYYDSADGKIYTSVSDDGFSTDGQIVSIDFPPELDVYDPHIIQNLGGIAEGPTWVVAEGEYVYWNADGINLQRVKKNATPSSVCFNCYQTSDDAKNVVFVANEYVYSTTENGGDFGIARVGPVSSESPAAVKTLIQQNFGDPVQAVCVIDASYDYKDKLVWITTQSPFLSGTYVSRINDRLVSFEENIEAASEWQTYSIAIDSASRTAYASQINSTQCTGFAPCSYEAIPSDCPGRVIRWNIDTESIFDAQTLWILPKMAYQIGFWSPSQEANDESDDFPVFWLVTSIIVGVAVLGAGAFFIITTYNDPERKTPLGRYSRYVKSIRSSKVDNDSFARNAFTIIDAPDKIINKDSRISVWDESGRDRVASNVSTASDMSAETTEGNAFDPAVYQSIKSVNLGKDRDGVNIIKAGFLQLWETGMFRGAWKKRWFVLTKANVRWYEDDPRETDNFTPLDEIPVQDLMNVVINSSFDDLPAGTCFDLVGSKRTLSFHASSKFESTEWKSAMWDMIADVHFPHRASQQSQTVVDPAFAKSGDLEKAAKDFAAAANTAIGAENRDASDTIITVEDPTIGDTIPSLPAESTTPAALADAARLAMTIGSSDSEPAGPNGEVLKSSAPEAPAAPGDDAAAAEPSKSDKSTKSTKSKRSKKKRGSKHSKSSKGSRKGSKSSKGSRGSKGSRHSKKKKGGSKHKSASSKKE